MYLHILQLRSYADCPWGRSARSNPTEHEKPKLSRPRPRSPSIVHVEATKCANHELATSELPSPSNFLTVSSRTGHVHHAGSQAHTCRVPSSATTPQQRRNQFPPNLVSLCYAIPVHARFSFSVPLCKPNLHEPLPYPIGLSRAAPLTSFTCGHSTPAYPENTWVPPASPSRQDARKGTQSSRGYSASNTGAPDPNNNSE